jgi:hypothetical protein
MSEPDIVEAWLENQAMERLEAYLQTGRRFRDVPLDALSARWVQVIQSWASDPHSKFDHREHEEIEAEMRLRRSEPPFAEVRAALDRIKQASRERIDELRQDDPVRFAQWEDEIEGSVEEFAADAKRTKN